MLGISGSKFEVMPGLTGDKVRGHARVNRRSEVMLRLTQVKVSSC